jgi:hypothetical protein
MKIIPHLVTIVFATIITFPAISSPDFNQNFGEDCEVILNEIVQSRVDLDTNDLAKQAEFSCKKMPNAYNVRSAIQAAMNSQASTRWELMKSLAIRTLAFVQIQRHGSSFETMSRHSATLITTNTTASGEYAFQKAAEINGVPGLDYADFEQRLLQMKAQSGVRNAPYTERQAYLALTRHLFETNF